MKKRRRIAVLTSGGDAPGMNACVRAVVRTAIYHGHEVFGVRNGYDGLVKGQLTMMSVRSVGNILQRGGTILGSSRSEEFRTKKGRARAFEVLKSLQITGLVVIGGDGTLSGAEVFSREFPIQVVGVPSTIDKDLQGTEQTIGFDTAVNTAVWAVDRIRDTADSHGRVFIVEVMGRNTGHLALEVALSVGAEYVSIPEMPLSEKKLIAKIQAGINRGKTGSLIVVAEREQPGFALQLANRISKKIQRDVRALILGHLQRGGSPTASDRNIASEFGVHAVEQISKGANRVVVGVLGRRIRTTPIAQVIRRRHEVDLERFRLVDILSI